MKLTDCSPAVVLHTEYTYGWDKNASVFPYPFSFFFFLYRHYYCYFALFFIFVHLYGVQIYGASTHIASSANIHKILRHTSHFCESAFNTFPSIRFRSEFTTSAIHQIVDIYICIEILATFSRMIAFHLSACVTGFIRRSIWRPAIVLFGRCKWPRGGKNKPVNQLAPTTPKGERLSAAQFVDNYYGESF